MEWENWRPLSFPGVRITVPGPLSHGDCIAGHGQQRGLQLIFTIHTLNTFATSRKL